mmetsp:Transcript_19305/g.27156  ORF Transcript_19305/g.27156 Transcript_19305/m.27156 type:complete len:276 (+) Transcript_19305:51-878(+)
MSPVINSLALPFQLLLQRMLAQHVSSDTDLNKIWEGILSMPGCEKEKECSLRQALIIINGSLVPGFQLEVRSVSLPIRFNDEDEGTQTVYHAVVNKNADDIAKSCAVGLTSNSLSGPHELALFRLILEKLVERSNKDDEDSDNDEDDDSEDNQENSRSRKKSSRKRIRGSGCQSSLSRIEMINLRMELAGDHADKLAIGQAEDAISDLEAGGWLVSGPSYSTDTGRNSTKRRRTSNGQGESAYLQIGPRTYMELGDMLSQLGLDQDCMPQSIINR